MMVMMVMMMKMLVFFFLVYFQKIVQPHHEYLMLVYQQHDRVDGMQSVTPDEQESIQLLEDARFSGLDFQM
jgi:hypothetical protein